MKKKLKENGITLVALVVTIIILLILAAVSIAVLTGDNGILDKAKKAKSETIVAQEKETIKIAYTSALSMKNLDEKITDEDLKRELDKLNANATASPKGAEGDIEVTFNETKNTYTIDNKGNIEPENLEQGSTGGSGTSGSDDDKEEKIYMTEEQVEDLVNQKITEALTPTDYIKPETENGVTVSSGGYYKVGNIIIVNMSVRIDTSIIQLSIDINDATPIIKNIPISGMNDRDVLLSGSYPYSVGPGDHMTEYTRAKVDKEGNIKACMNSEHPYQNNYGFDIWGVYVTK